MPEKFGVETFFGTSDFARGLDTYLRGLQQAMSATQSAERAIGGGGGRGGGMAGSLGALDVAMGVATGGISILAVAVGNVLASAFEAVTQAVQNAISAIVEFGTNCLQIAGRVDELQRAALLLGQMAGYSADEVQGFLDELAEVGIRADVAARLISQLARYNLDLTQATNLATVAQNAAVLAGIDSSDALDRLTQAAMTNQVRMARNVYVMVDFQKAQEELARQLGVTKDELTADQIVQANFNALLEEGQRVAGVYGVAMESPTKALRSLGREIFNLQAALGAPFLGAWATVIGIVRDFVAGLTAAVQEGGALYPLMVNLGAVAALVAEGLSGLVDALVDGVLPSLDDLADMVLGVAEDAFNWGASIVANLAQGIIDAAASILVAAMNYIGSILSSWLGPGSPPRVAPELDKWGTEAMAEYLKGFTEADFDVLGKLTSIFKRALGKEGLAGVMDELLTAVNIGQVTDDLFAQIVAASGPMGAELAELARLETDYAAAMERANAANEALAQSQSDVARLQAEYNDMLRAGASEEQLKAKLAQINAAEEARDAAKAEAKAAGKNVDEMESQVKTQEDLVAAMTELLDLQKEMAKGGGGGGGGGGGARAGAGLGAGPEFPKFEGGDFDIESALSDAIDKAKEKIKEELFGPEGVFTPLIDDANRAIGEIEKAFGPFVDSLSRAWDEISGAGERFFDTLQTFWDEHGPGIEKAAKEMFDTIGQAVGDLASNVLPWLIEQIDKLSAWIAYNGPTIEAAFRNISIAVGFVATSIANMWQFVEPLLTGLVNVVLQVAQTVLEILAGDWDKAWRSAIGIVAEVIGAILAAIEGFLNWIANMLGTSMGEIRTQWSQNWEMLKVIISTVWQNIQTAIEEFRNTILDGINDFLVNIVSTAAEKWEEFKQNVSDTWASVVETITTKVTEVYDTITGKIQDIVDWIGEQVETFKKLGESLIQGIKQGILNKIGELIAAAVKAVQDALNAAKEAIGVGSPSKLAAEQIGVPFAEGIALGIRQGMLSAMRDIQNSVVLPVRFASQAASGTDNRNYSKNANFHIGNINTPMDEASFRVMADRWFAQRARGAG